MLYIYRNRGLYKRVYKCIFYDLNTDESNDIIHSISLNDLLNISIKDIVKEFDNFYNDNY